MNYVTYPFEFFFKNSFKLLEMLIFALFRGARIEKIIEYIVLPFLGIELLGYLAYELAQIPAGGKLAGVSLMGYAGWSYGTLQYLFSLPGHHIWRPWLWVAGFQQAPPRSELENLMILFLWIGFSLVLVTLFSSKLRPYLLSLLDRKWRGALLERARLRDERKREADANKMGRHETTLGLTDHLFVGWSSDSRWQRDLGKPGEKIQLGRRLKGRAVFTENPEESLGIFGPSRSGKTLNSITSILTWNGPLVVTSTKQDVIKLTGNRRRELARDKGGDIYLYDPRQDFSHLGLSSISWSPLEGCEDPKIAVKRADDLIGDPDELSRDSFFKSNAKPLLRFYLHAAALGDYSMTTVKSWLARHDFQEARDVILARSPEMMNYRVQRDAGGKAAQIPGIYSWIQQMESLVGGAAQETINNFFQLVDSCIRWSDDPTILTGLANPDFNIDHFLESNSTLYVLDSEGNGRNSSLAPLVAAFIEEIVNRQYARFRKNEQSSRLSLVLDEIANISPLPSLPSIVSQGGGQGVVVTAIFQSFDQLDQRWRNSTQSILDNLSNKLIFGGLGDARVLEDISKLIGEYEKPKRSHNLGFGPASDNLGLERVRRVPAEDLAKIPHGKALWMHRNEPTYVWAPPGPALDEVKPLLGWDPDNGSQPSIQEAPASPERGQVVYF